MNRAEIVEETKKRILAQGGYSLEGRSCRDSSSDGKRCAVGVWLPEDFDTSEFEGASVCGLQSEVINILPIDDKGFWVQVQNIHDDCAREGFGLDDFAKKMDALKARVSL